MASTALPYRAKALALALTTLFNYSAVAETTVATTEPQAKGNITETVETGTLEVPSIVQRSLRDGDEVLHSFHDGDLTGWVVKPVGMKPVIAYTANKDQVLIYGEAVANKGDLFALAHEDKIKPFLSKPKMSVEAASLDLDSLNGFSEGASDTNADKTIYAFIDTSCVFCHYAYLAMRPYIEQTKTVQVRWIPVALLSEDSVSKAAALVESGNPQKLLKTMNKEWNEIDGVKFPVSSEPSEKGVAMVEANTQFLRNLGSESTPTFLHQDESGKLTLTKGMQSLDVFANWFDTKPIENKSEKLARFL